MSILTVITDEKEANALVRWSFQFARARQCPLIILRAQETEGQDEILDYDADAKTNDDLINLINETLESEITQAEDTSATPHFDYHTEEEISTTMLKTPEVDIKIIKGANLAKSVLKMISQSKPSLLLLGRHQSLRGNKHYTDIIFQRSHCDTMILRLGEADFQRCSSLLIPCSGGPHCLEAMKDAAQLSVAQGTVVTPLIIEPDSGDMMEEVGKHTLQNLLKSCGLKEDNFIKPRVAISDDIEEGISNVAAEGFDMVILGASDMGSLRKKLFGSLSEKMMNKNPALSIAIYRKKQSTAQVILDKIEHWCNLAVPQLNREQRVTLYESLYMNSTWNFDFVSLICLSTAIASLGLISNSAAVVIGAMLVAPLMVPILASGLALVQGNIPLIINAARSICLGFLAALCIGIFCGLVTPMDFLTSEIISRGSPKLADMFIAFLSGVAAAHCMSRPKLSAALPGVAIAAALVPPIASTGIALSMGFTKIAMGAAVLFFTNVVCIILGSSITFLAAGIRSKNRQKSKAWVQQCIIGLILCLSLLLIPLSSALISKVTVSFRGVKTENIENDSLQVLKNFGITEITDTKINVSNKKDKTLKLVLDVDSTKDPGLEAKEALEKFLEKQLQRPVDIKLRVTLIIQ